MNTKFERLDERCLYGYGAYRDDGIRVEVVRCYEGEWSVFLTRNSEVCARSIEDASALRQHCNFLNRHLLRLGLFQPLGAAV